MSLVATSQSDFLLPTQTVSTLEFTALQRRCSLTSVHCLAARGAEIREGKPFARITEWLRQRWPGLGSPVLRPALF